MAAMGPVGWTMLGLSALSMLGGMGGKKQEPTQFLDPIKVGAKPTMSAPDPYASPITSAGANPYGIPSNPMMRRQPTFSSTLGRYGGFG